MSEKFANKKIANVCNIISSVFLTDMKGSYTIKIVNIPKKTYTFFHRVSIT